MTKFYFLLIMTIGLAPFFLGAQQQSDDVRYVTDDLQTFMHSGPGRNYRILGSITAGTQVTILQTNQEKGFFEVIDVNQRTGWIESQYITEQRSVKELLPEVQDELRQAQTHSLELSEQNELLNQQVSDLTTRNALLVKNINEIQEDNQRIQKELDMQDQSAQMKWFTRGGIIALVSILLGVIIAYLPKKRRRNDQWM